MQIYLVGGAVRDALLGLPIKDRDYVVIGATDVEMLHAGFRQVGRDFPVFLHPETGEEYALARTERKCGRGYHGFVFDFTPEVTLEEDLIRRDLTINAMAQANDGSIIDPYGGQKDLAARVLRHVSSAFTEDPLRVLRLMRFWARFASYGFTIDEETLSLCRKMVAERELHELTAERVWNECERALGYSQPHCFFTGLATVGALFVLTGEAVEIDDETLAKMNRALAAAASHSQSPELRFALWAEGQETVIAALKSRLPLPTRFAKWLDWVCDYASSIRDWEQTSGEMRWNVFKGLGAFKDATALRQLLEALAIDALTQERMMAALAAAHAISPQSVMADGFKGAALGDELKRRQIEAITAK